MTAASPVRAIAVDHEGGFAHQLKRYLGCDWLDPAGDSPADIAARIAASQRTVVYLNVDLLCQGHVRRQMGGLEVFKFLRLTDRFGAMPNHARAAPCVLYSFRSLEQLIRQNPASAILCSEGTSFCRLPLDPRALVTQRPVPLNRQPDRLEAFIQAGLILPDEQHGWANWYGAWQMLRVHALADRRTTGPEADALVPNDPHVRDALFVYGTPAGLSVEAIRAADGIAERRLQLRDQLVDGAENRFKIGVIDDQAAQIGGAPFGWQRVYSRMLFGTDDGVDDLLGGLSGTRPAPMRRVNSFLNEFRFGDYACLLLDLRLEGERGPADPQALSGARVLKWLRSRWPTLPVIVATASNKSQSVLRLMKLGADGYWVKERIDTQASASSLVCSYLALLDEVLGVTAPAYQFLRRFGYAVKCLSGRQTFGWDCASWMRKEPLAEQQRRYQVAREIMGEILLLLRQHLQTRRIGYTPEAEFGERIALLSIIQHAGKLIEAIHGWTRSDRLSLRATVGGTLMKDRHDPVILGGVTQWAAIAHGDWAAWSLLDMRNDASHYAPSTRLKWTDMTWVLAFLVSYLNEGPQPEFCSDPGTRWPRFPTAPHRSRDTLRSMVRASPAYRRHMQALRP